MTTVEQIEALCNSPDIPDNVKRHFAADYAERIMFDWCKRTGNEPIPAWWEIMDAIRNFAEGKITFEALQEIRQVFWSADWAAFWTDRVAYYAAYSAADSAADASYYAADNATDRAAEREWQLQYFHALIAQHNAMKARLLGLLNRRAEEITQALPQALKQYEEALFI